MPRDGQVFCMCCNSWITRHREREHKQRRQAPYLVSQLPTRTASKLIPITSISSDESSDSDLIDNPMDDVQIGPLPFIEEDNNGRGNINSNSPERMLRSWARQKMRSDASHVPRAATSALGLEVASTSDESEDSSEDSSEEETPNEDNEGGDFPEWDEFRVNSGEVPAADLLNEGYEEEAAAIAEKLSAYDRAICHAFSFKLQTNLTDRGYSKIPLAFQADPPLPKIDAMRARVSFLAGFKPQRFDCCPNSCVCYTGLNEELQACPHCNEPRFHANGLSRKQFTYIPIIPRLLASFRNAERAKEMLYRSEHVHDPSKTTDVFDGALYHQLCSENVDIDGQKQQYNHFSNNRDIALGLSTDGFAPFKRRKSTAWPLILFNYNLPPDKRFHIEEILALGVIPGPKKPMDIDSFLWPAILEFIQLAQGVAAFDVLKTEIFALRAYLILVFGDIPAISMLMHMKGHNGFSPCRMCGILGVRNPMATSNTNYIPHNRSRHPDISNDPTAVKAYDMANLPLRTHAELLAQAREVQAATSNSEAERLSRRYGIKGVPVLSCLSSLKFPGAFPYDFMHLIWENLVKNLILHWTGDFKGLGEGSGSYFLERSVWQAVGSATAASGSTIPSAYGSRVPNIATDSALCTADMWSFWTLFLGPVLLRRRFLGSNLKYFNHFIQLVRLLNICLKFEISKEETSDLHTGFIKWVRDYEKLYYQYSPERVSACPLTIHALLHIADSIKACGPVWCYWAYPMERYCGKLQPALWSRRFPYAALDRFVLEDAQLTQIKLTSGLVDELSLRMPRKSVVGAFRHPSYEDFILMPACQTAEPSAGLFTRICAAIATRIDSKDMQHVRKFANLATIEQWGRIRRVDSEDGDTMWASSLNKGREDTRDATFVRYAMYVDINERHRRREISLQLRTCYGQLRHIFLLKFQDPEARRALKLTAGALDTDVMILVAIQSCILEPDDPNLRGLDIHFYSKMGAVDVVDATCLQCVVGRVKDSEGWAIIDRSGSLVRPIQEINNGPGVDG